MFVTKPHIRDRKVRFALVGCGRISANHIEALRKHTDRAELVAVCDIDAAALARAVDATGAPGFASLEQLLAGCDADAIILATPSGRLSARSAMTHWLMMSTTTATTRSRWIKLPPTCESRPTNQSTNKITRIVHSMIEVSLFICC